MRIFNQKGTSQFLLKCGPKSLKSIVFIGTPEQQDRCGVSKHGERHLADSFAGDPFCSGAQVSGLGLDQPLAVLRRVWC